MNSGKPRSDDDKRRRSVSVRCTKWHTTVLSRPMQAERTEFSAAKSGQYSCSSAFPTLTGAYVGRENTAHVRGVVPMVCGEGVSNKQGKPEVGESPNAGTMMVMQRTETFMAEDKHARCFLLWQVKEKRGEQRTCRDETKEFVTSKERVETSSKAVQTATGLVDTSSRRVGLLHQISARRSTCQEQCRQIDSGTT